MKLHATFKKIKSAGIAILMAASLVFTAFEANASEISGATPSEPVSMETAAPINNVSKINPETASEDVVESVSPGAPKSASGSVSHSASSSSESSSVALSGAPLTARHRAVSIFGQDDEIWFLFEPAGLSAKVIQLLEASVQAGEISESEAEQIFIEMSELTGARYELPKTRREIMAALGFPEGTVMLATNWFEMAAVHLETSLSMSSLASRFVLQALGVKLVTPPESSVDVPVAVPVVEPVEVRADEPKSVPVDKSSVRPTDAASSQPVVVKTDGDSLSLETTP